MLYFVRNINLSTIWRDDALFEETLVYNSDPESYQY